MANRIRNERLEIKLTKKGGVLFEEHKVEIIRYEMALSKLKKCYSKLPNSKDILDKLDKLQEKRIP